MNERKPSATAPPTSPPSQPTQSTDARKSPSATSPRPISSGWCAWPEPARRGVRFFARAVDFGRAFGRGLVAAMSGAFVGAEYPPSVLAHVQTGWGVQPVPIAIGAIAIALFTQGFVRLRGRARE